MSEVGGAVVAASLVLCAVFVPSAFVAGISGQFFRQFAVTIAVSTLISLFVSLTLSPALARRADARPRHGEPPDAFTRLWNRLLGGFFRQFNRAFAAATARYVTAVGGLLRRSGLALAAYAALLAATILLFRSVPTGFIPAQDQGYLITVIQLPDGASLERTDAVVRQAAEIALDVEGVTYAVEFVGFSGATRANAANAAAIFVGLAPFEERDESGRRAPELIAELNEKFSAVQDGFVTVIPPPPVQGLGTAGGFKLYVQDRGVAAAPRRSSRRPKRSSPPATQDPALRGLFTTSARHAAALRRRRPHRAKTMNVPLGNVFEALQVYLGSVYVNDFNYLGRTFQVRAQADTAFRADERDVARFKTRNRAGEMVLARRGRRSEADHRPDRVVRYNLFPAAEINGDSRARGQLRAGARGLDELAGETLPAGFGIAWTDLAYQELLAGNTALVHLRALASSSSS